MPGRNPNQDLFDESFIESHAEIIAQLERACQAFRERNHCSLADDEIEPIVKSFMDLLLASAESKLVIQALTARAENINLFFDEIEKRIPEDGEFDFGLIGFASQDFFLAVFMKEEMTQTSLLKTQLQAMESDAAIVEDSNDNFLDRVCSATNSNLNQNWKNAFVECAQHWQTQVENENFAVEIERFLSEIRKVSNNIADMQKPHGPFAKFKKEKQKLVAKSFLFGLTYENELKVIEQQSSTLRSNLPALNAESIKYSYAGNDDAAKQAYDCCEKTVKLFSKNAKPNPDNSDLPKAKDYPALKQSRTEKIVESIASAVRVLFPSRFASYLKKKGYSFFAGPTQAKPEILVEQISSSAAALVNSRGARS